MLLFWRDKISNLGNALGIPYAALFIGLVLLSLGCSREKAELREAGARHREPIGAVAALAPILIPGPDGKTAAFQYGALLARQALLSQAVHSADWRRRFPSREEETATERIAAAVATMMTVCSAPKTDDNADRLALRNERCRDALAALDESLAKDELRAEVLGLPKGTIPRLKPAFESEKGRFLAKRVQAAIATPKEEVERRSLWSDEKSPKEALLHACQQAGAILEKRPYFDRDYAQSCQQFQTVLGILEQVRNCATEGKGPACKNPGLCGALRSYLKDRVLPAGFLKSVQEEATRCDQRFARRP